SHEEQHDEKTSEASQRSVTRSVGRLADDLCDDRSHTDVSGGLRALPVLAQNFAAPDVVPGSAREEVIATRTDGPVAVPLERASTRLVPNEDLGHDLVEV